MTIDHHETAIEAHPTLPMITLTRDFAATPAQLVRAHLDPKLFVRWIGPDRLTTRLELWEPRRGGGYRYVQTDSDGSEYAFFGSFHDIGETRLVQTFTFEGYPDGVSLDTMLIEDLGDGRARRGASLSSREVGHTSGEGDAPSRLSHSAHRAMHADRTGCPSLWPRR